MAAKVTFDTVNKLIICKAGITELDVQIDIYSDAKEDWLIDPALTAFRFPFRSIGGDDTTPGEVAPMYLYLKFGWKIRPDEANHILNIVGGAILDNDDTTRDPFADTLDPYNVRVRMYVPVMATQVEVDSGSGLTAEEHTQLMTRPSENSIAETLLDTET